METRNCQNCKNDFEITMDDFGFYEKIKVPPPTFCPECRMIRRFHFRNEGMLFRRKDAHHDNEVFSTFSPEANVKTIESNDWYSASWEPFDSGMDYNFKFPFFTQFQELLSKAPIPARSMYNLLNSDYCNEASYLKNSYLCFNVDYLENCGYIRKMTYTKDSFDLYEGTENELCYESIMVDKSYQTFYSLDCESCVDVWFSKGLRGCTNCFGCVNLINKSNYFFNQKYSKEEYEKKVKEFDLGSYKVIQQIIEESLKLWNQFPNKYLHGLRLVNSTGERIFDAKNVKNSYSVRQGENLKFCQDIQPKASNSYDYTTWGPGENIYECVTVGAGAYNLRFCFNCWEEARDMEYSGYCIGSSDCFGCVGLYKKQYCILNKQYSKEEYFDLVEKIKKQMNEVPYIDSKGRIYKYGEFFPFSMSPIAYNESMANDYFPINQEIALEKGYQWREIKLRDYKITISSEDLPDNLKDIDDSILNEVIGCVNCERPFRIIGIELQFYKRFNLPLPRKCHNCRFIERFKFVNPPKLWHRACMCDKVHNNHEGKCEVEFETSYAPERPEIVYCEKCYQEEVY